MREYLIVVLLQKLACHDLVSGQQLAESRERVAGDVEHLQLDVAEESEQFVRVQNQAREDLVSETVPEHQAAIKRDLRGLVAAHQQTQHLLVRQQIVNRREPITRN